MRSDTPIPDLIRAQQEWKEYFNQIPSGRQFHANIEFEYYKRIAMRTHCATEPAAMTAALALVKQQFPIVKAVW